MIVKRARIKSLLSREDSRREATRRDEKLIEEKRRGKGNTDITEDAKRRDAEK